MTLIELRIRGHRALDRNRNYRQATTLLIHYGALLRTQAQAMKKHCIHERLTLCSTSVGRVSQSVSLLVQTGEALARWGSDSG